MKKPFLVTVLFFALTAAFSQGTAPASYFSAIQDIEDIKQAISLSESAELRTVLASEYERLENTTFIESSNGSHVYLTVGNYDTKSQSWPLTISTVFFGTGELFSFQTNLNYAELMGKRFVKTSDMTERQVTDYEESVSAYDNLLHSGEGILYAELYFKIYRWKEASEYLFAPVLCTVANTRLKSKIILNVDCTENTSTAPKTFSVSPKIEVRTAQEKNADSRRIIVLKKTESPAQEEPAETADTEQTDSKKSNWRGRQGVFVLANLERSDMDFSSLDSIINISPCLQGDFNFAPLKFLFLGFDVGVNFLENSYYIGYFNGLNFQLGKHIVPFARAGLDARTNGMLDIRLGGGSDFVFGGVAFTAGYNCSLRYDLNTASGENFFQAVKSAFSIDPTILHAIYVGLGIRW